MSRKLVLLILIVSVLSISSFAAWKHFVRPKQVSLKDYNILLISVDTARADFFGCYGNPAVSTPHMDALAAQGVLFENFYTNINATLPAHSSIMTGLYPPQHGVARNSMRLASSNLTLAEFLGAKNYRTAAFIGSFVLASTFGFHQGFETFNETFHRAPPHYVEKEITMKSNKKLGVVEHETNIRQITRIAEEVNQAFFRWLNKNNNQKFFAFVHYYDPHFPYAPPAKWRTKHLPAIPPGVPLTQVDRNPLEASFKKNIDPAIAFRPSEIHRVKYKEEVNALLKLYLSEIEYTDFALGQLIDQLEKKNLRSKTIIIVTADHGENLVEHWEMNKFFGHGSLTFETETHVPFIISCPGVIPSGKRIKQIASHVDIFPTIANLIGEKYPLQMKGISLAPDLWNERPPINRPVYSEACQPYLDWNVEAANVKWLNQQNSASIHWGDYKYIHMPLRSYEAVFQISHDKTEEDNILNKLRTQKPELLTAFRTRMQDLREKFMAGNVDTTFQLSEEDREKLESLGYVQ
jgi:arylsulfatase A-like enzyme